jgi:preprotein translocase subunit SecG
MNTLFNLIVVVQVISALSIIGLVLLQHGKGADMGAAFGSGASGSLFGASGSSNFLSKMTAFAAVVFFSATLALAYLGTDRTGPVEGGGVMERAGQAVPTATVPAPAAPAATVPAAPATGVDAVPAAPAPTVPAKSSGDCPLGDCPLPLGCCGKGRGQSRRDSPQPQIKEYLF